MRRRRAEVIGLAVWAAALVVCAAALVVLLYLAMR